MQRFFLPPGSLRSGATASLDEYAHQLHAVLRLQPGAPLLLLDDSGFEYDAILTEATARHARALVGEGRPCLAEPRLRLTLYVCTLKADKFEWVLQKGVELGVAHFVPVVSRRSVVRPAAALVNKAARWRQVVREAAEQSGRGRLPVVGPALDFARAIAASRPSTDLRLCAWEGANAGAPAMILGGLEAARAAGHGVSLLTGPEGGLDASEVQLAVAGGWLAVSMGRRILRAETAALAGAAVLMALSGELGSLSP